MQPYPQPTHAPRRLSARERHLGQTAPRERLRGGNSDVSNARGTPNGTLHARLTTKMCTTLFADRNQRLYIMPPNALHRSVSYRTCGRETRVISPVPIANRLTQCRPPVEALSSNSSRSTLRGTSARQQKISPVENSPVENDVCAYTLRSSPNPSPRQATNVLKAHDLLWIFQVIPLTM